MYIIEPCCAKRHLNALRNDIGKGGTADFEGYGDLSLSELLPAMLTHYSETELLIAAPSLPDPLADVLKLWMKQQWSRADGKGKLDAIHHLTIIADLSEEKSPTVSQWLKDNPFGERLALVDMKQDETAILLPDFAITGPVNLRYGERFTATATTDPERLSGLWNTFLAMAKKQEEKAVKELAESPAQEATELAVPAKKRRRLPDD